MIKNNINEQFGFYGILTNPLKGYEYVTNVLVQEEVKFIQLRMKNESELAVLKMAEKLKKIIDGSNSIFIVNDYPIAVKEIDVDGVHIGQEDMSYEEVLKLVGENKIIGLSTHNNEQCDIACKKKPSYIGVGPVYKTPTKVIADPPLGLNKMSNMLNIATVPAVVLGAIDTSNLHSVLESGAKNFSSVRPINSSENPEKALKELLAIYSEFH